MRYNLTGRILFLVCLFILLPQLLTAQQATQATQQAILYNQKAAYFNRFNQSDSALIYYQKAATLYKNTDKVAYAAVKLEEVEILNNIGATEAAYKRLRACRSYILKNIGRNSSSMVQYYLRSAKFYDKQKNYQVVDAFYLKALSKAREIHGPGSLEEANILRLQACRQSDAESSVNTALKALSILEKKKNTSNYLESAVIYNAAATEFLNLAYYNQNAPITVAEKEYESTFQAAIDYFTKAYDAAVKEYNDVTPFAASILHNIGIVYESKVYIDPEEGITPQKLENWNKALEYYNLSNHFGISRRYSIIPLNMVCMGIVHADMGDLDKALYWYHQGLKFKIKSFNSDDIYDLPEISSLHLTEKVSMLLEYKAYAFRDRYNKTGNIKDLDAFYRHALKLAETLERMRDQAKLYHESEDGPAVTLMSENYALAIEACQELYQKTGNKKYIREGFTIAEKFKNHNLLYISQKQKMMQYLKGNEQALADYKKLSGKVKYFDELVKLTNENAAYKQVELFKHAADSLKVNENRFNAFLAEMKVKHPGFYEEKVENDYVATLPEMQEMLPDNKTAAVIYVRHFAQSEVQPNLYAFIVEKDQTHFLKIDLPARFDAEIDSLVQAIVTNKMLQYKQFSLEMNELIFEPIFKKLSKNVENLILMPDGKLWQIPFGALLTSKTTQHDYRKLPYLINRFTIQYAHTATLLKNYTSNKPSFFYQDKILALAPFADKNLVSKLQQKHEINLMHAEKENNTYNSLPFTTKLLYKLQDQLSGKFLMDTAATEHYFKQNAANFSVLHLATHAEADLTDPLNSKFILAKSKNEDGELRMDELFRLNLKPELAVLSACETGVGAIKAGGEGMLSLAWIFNYLGCPSTISSLWKVDDRNTSLLLEKFYTHLADGKAKNIALHLAKTEMIQKARTSAEANPFYWSSFVFVGDPEPLQLSPLPFITILVVSGFVLLLLIVSLFFYRFRKIRSKNAFQELEAEV